MWYTDMHTDKIPTHIKIKEKNKVNYSSNVSYVLYINGYDVITIQIGTSFTLFSPLSLELFNVAK